MYKVKILNSIKNANKADWDAIVNNDNIICKYDFLKAVEEGNINDCEFFYVLVFDEANKLVAHTWFFSMTMDMFSLASGAAKKVINGLRKFFPNFFMIKILECGAPVAIGNILSFGTNIHEEQSAMLNLIMDKMKELAGDKKAKLQIFRDYNDNELQFHKEFLNHGYFKVDNLPDAELEIQWKTFEEYLGCLRYNYRRFVKKCMAAIKSENIKVEITKDFSNIASNLRGLYFNCYTNAKEYRREVLTEEFFVKADEYMKDKSVVLLLKKDEDIVGFAFFLLDDLTARLVFVGFDYDTRDKYFTYFNIFYQGLKFAIENGFKRMELGITTYEFKSKMGGIIVPIYSYIQSSDFILNTLLKSMKSVFFPETKVEEKHPFREGDEK